MAVAEEVQRGSSAACVPTVAMCPRRPRRPRGARCESAGRKPVHRMTASTGARVPSAQTAPSRSRRSNIGDALSRPASRASRTAAVPVMRRTVRVHQWPLPSVAGADGVNFLRQARDT